MITNHRSMAASNKKTDGLRPAGAYQARTQTQETYKTHHRNKSSETEKQPLMPKYKKKQHNQNAYHSLRWNNGLHLDDNRRPALAAAEAAADGVITTATQTRRRTPQPQQRHQPHQRHNRQWPPAELDHSNLWHAQKLYTGDGNCRKQNFDHPDQHARYIRTDEYRLRDTKTTKENTANGRDTKPMRSRT